MNTQPATAQANQHEVELAGDDRDALLAGLQTVLSLANGGGENAPGNQGTDATVAVPIQGNGRDIADLFASLTADLLDQVETSGGGLDAVRLDGVLQTDDGGVRGWGYLIGAMGRPLPPVRCERIANTTGSQLGVRIRCMSRAV